MDRVVRSLESFFFRPIPATTFAVMRIAVGSLALIWSATLLSQADPLLTWLRIDAVGDIGWWQFWPSAPDGFIVALILCLVVASALMTIGLWARPATWAVFLLVLIIHRYNPLAFNGGDFILRSVLLLGLALSPAGAYLSIDSWRKSGAMVWTAPQVSAWTLRFIQLHISMGYILTVLLKLRGETWLGGTAMWYALGLEELTRFDVPSWISTPPVGAVLGWTTLAIELGVGVGVWIRKVRPYALVAGVLLHIGIAALFEIGFFSYVMVVSYLAFLPLYTDVRGLLRYHPSGLRDIPDPSPV